jgi:hypothetical protein
MGSRRCWWRRRITRTRWRPWRRSGTGSMSTARSRSPRTVREAREIAQAARKAKVATQMGNQGMAFEGNRPDQGVARGRRDRAGAGGARVVGSSDPAGKAAGLVDAGDRASAGHAAGAGASRLGSLARAGSRAAVSPGLRAVRLAGLVGFRFGRSGGHGHPQSGAGIRRPEAGPADARFRELHAGVPGDRAARFDGPFRVRRAGRPAGRGRALVRRWPAAAPAAGARTGPSPGCRGRCDPDRGSRYDADRRVGRRDAATSAPVPPQGVPTAGTDAASLDRAPPGMGRGVQEG